MAKLTARQKEKLITHSKRHSTTHVNAMASLMRKGRTFSEAHKKVTRNEAKSKQKQKQTQIQRVVINLGGQGKSKRPRRAPRATTQAGSSQVLAEFSTMLPPPPAMPAQNSFPQFTPPQPLASTQPVRAAVPVSKPVTLPTPTFVRPPSVKTQSIVGPAPLETPPLVRTKSLEEQFGDLTAATQRPEVQEALAAVEEALAASESVRPPPPAPPTEPAQKKRGVAKGTKRGPYKKAAQAMGERMMTPVMAEAVSQPFNFDPAGEDVRASMRIRPSREALKMMGAGDPMVAMGYPPVDMGEAM